MLYTVADGAALDETARIVRTHGRDAHAHVVDIADARAVDDLAAHVLAARGAVDVLVNNAGVAVVAPFARTGPAEWAWLSGVNLFGPLRLTRALLPHMIERGSGHIVMVASLAGLVGGSSDSRPRPLSPCRGGSRAERESRRAAHRARAAQPPRSPGPARAGDDRSCAPGRLGRQ